MWFERTLCQFLIRDWRIRLRHALLGAHRWVYAAGDKGRAFEDWIAPGRLRLRPAGENIGLIMTILLGALGSFLGSWITYSVGYSNSNGGFAIIPFLVGIVVAVVLIAAYLGITGRRNAQPRT